MSQPPPFPMPAEPLGYGNPYYGRRRPGILTAVGVLSIIVAGLSFLASAGWGVGALVLMKAAAVPIVRPLPPAPVPATVPAVAPTTSASSGGLVAGDRLIMVSEDGLDADQIVVVIGVLERRRRLSDEQKHQLESLFAQTGKKIFPNSKSGELTPASIRSEISQHGATPGVGGGGSTWFMVAAGRIEAWDDHAVFRPSGSVQTISVSAKPTSGFSTVAIGTPAPPAARPVPPPRPPPTTMLANPLAGLSMTGLWLMIGESAASVLLAVYLAIIGIMVLRDARSGARLHWIYIWMKIPLIIVAAIGTYMMWHGVAQQMPGSHSRSLVWWVMMNAVISLAYPIGLFFVLMNNRTVRNYYSSVVE